MIQRLMETVQLINTNLDTSPASWRDQLPAIRNTIVSFEITDSVPEEERRNWQLPLISVFQRVAFADADNGVIQDLADWCLRQLVTLLQIYPDNVDILTRKCLCIYIYIYMPITANRYSNRSKLVAESAKGSVKHCAYREKFLQ